MLPEEKKVAVRDLLQDLRFSLRSMARNPGLTTIHVFLVAVSIGLTCSAFVVMDTVLLRPLPATVDPDRLVLVSGARDNGNRVEGQPFPIFDLLADLLEGTTHIFGYRNYGALPATAGTTTWPVRGIGVVGDYFGGLGMAPLRMGRVFDPDSNEPVTVIAHWVWQDRFGGAADVLGRTVTLGTVVFTVVGVAAEDFLGTQPDLRWDLIAPFAPLARARGIPAAAIRDQGVFIVARLKPGVSPAQYEARIAPVWPSILQATAPAGETLEQWTTRRGARLVVDSLRHGQTFTVLTRPGLPRALRLTVALAVLIFVASCITLSLLVVARAVRDQRHAVIRLALGGSRWRIARPQVIEAGVTSLLGGLGGLLMAAWGSDLARSFVPGSWPFGLTTSAIGLAVGMAAATTALAGGLAGSLLTHRSVAEVLQSGGRTSRPHLKLRAILLVTQFAVAVVLIHSTLLYIADFSALAKVETGLNAQNLRVFTLAGRLPQRTLDAEYFQRLQTELQEIPGAQSVGLGGGAPPLAFVRDLTERVHTAGGRQFDVVTTCAFPGAFESWGTRQLAGRDLAWTDGPFAVVTESLARKLNPAQHPIGELIQREAGQGRRELQVVGIVGDMAFNGPRLGMRDVVFMTCPEWFSPWRSSGAVNVFIRSSRTVAELGQDVSRVADRLGVHYLFDMGDQEEIVAGSMAREEMLATLSSAFGGLILLMTGVSLYAFCNYVLAFRRRELAIRAGLGATPRDIAASLLQETVAVLVAGVALGLFATMLLTRLLSGFVVDIGSLTAANAVQATLILALVTGLASSVPTLRALRIDIARALRVD
jgi:predicted permease